PSGKPASGQVIALGPMEATPDSQQRFQIHVNREGGRSDELRAAPGRYQLVATPVAADVESGAMAAEVSITADGEIRLELSAERYVVRCPVELGQGEVLVGANLHRVQPAQPEFWIYLQVDAGGDG